MSSFKLFVCLYFSLFFLNPLHGMLVYGKSIVSPDTSKYIPFLGHYHGKGSCIEARQLDELVSIVKEGVAQGKKFHVLYEKAGDLLKFTPVRAVLSDLEEVFAESQVVNCTIENVEIRDLSAAALHLLDEKEKVLEYSNLSWNKGGKSLGEITFQDLFDEFEKYAPAIKQFVEQITQENNKYPYLFLIAFKYEDSCGYLDEVKKLLTSKNLSLKEKVLAQAIQNSDAERIAFERMIRWSFSALFDLHILHRLTQLDPDVQPIVITGALHSVEVPGLLSNRGWESHLLKGDIFQEVYRPINYDAMRSIILNETEWALRTKDILKYLASIKLSIEGKLRSFLAYLK